MVAAISRTSTGIGSVPPTRSISRSWTARRILLCSARLMSPISSRNSVPPLARSNRPIFRATAPVNAPFSWPNSSLSRRFSGMAAQLTVTNGAADLGPCKWTARATSSFPVPDSPTTSTVAVLGATWAMDRNTGIITGLSDTIWVFPTAIGRASASGSGVSCSGDRTRSIISRKRSRPTGIESTSKTPLWVARRVNPIDGEATRVTSRGRRPRRRSTSTHHASCSSGSSSSTASTMVQASSLRVRSAAEVSGTRSNSAPSPSANRARSRSTPPSGPTPSRRSRGEPSRALGTGTRRTVVTPASLLPPGTPPPGRGRRRSPSGAPPESGRRAPAGAARRSGRGGTRAGYRRW